MKTYWSIVLFTEQNRIDVRLSNGGRTVDCGDRLPLIFRDSITIVAVEKRKECFGLRFPMGSIEGGMLSVVLYHVLDIIPHGLGCSAFVRLQLETDLQFVLLGRIQKGGNERIPGIS